MSHHRAIVALPPPYTSAFGSSGLITSSFIGLIRLRTPRFQSGAYTGSTLTMRLSPKSLQHSLYDIMSQPDTPLTNQTKQQSNWRKRLERNSWEVDNSSGSAGMRESSLLGCRNFIRTVPHYISIVPYYGLLDALHLYQRTHTTFDDYEWLRIL